MNSAVSRKRVVVTGANGFIGKNLIVRLSELGSHEVLPFVRGDNEVRLRTLLAGAHFVVHLAGENRPADSGDFFRNNADLTRLLCDSIVSTGRKIPMVLASSAQATEDNLYGKSKLQAEIYAEKLAHQSDNPVLVYRFPGVFGKWCKPHYNSVVATFCHNIARGSPIRVDDAGRCIQLVHVDDVVDTIVRDLGRSWSGFIHGEIAPVHSITVGELARRIQGFDGCRTSLLIDAVGSGLARALYSTYISYLPENRFSYPVPKYADPRGAFVEMLKTPEYGQLSFFTMAPGVSRGSHYHHTKTEKFLLVKGQAVMRFRSLLTGAINEITLCAAEPRIVDTIPGWVHEIFNPGNEEAVVMLWANEVFDRSRPDTVAARV